MPPADSANLLALAAVVCLVLAASFLLSSQSGAPLPTGTMAATPEPGPSFLPGEGIPPAGGRASLPPDEAEPPLSTPRPSPAPTPAPTLALVVPERTACVPGPSLARNADCPSEDCREAGCSDACGYLYRDFVCPCERCLDLARFQGATDCSGEPTNTWEGLSLVRGQWFEDNVAPEDSLRYRGQRCPGEAGWSGASVTVPPLPGRAGPL